MTYKYIKCQETHLFAALTVAGMPKMRKERETLATSPTSDSYTDLVTVVANAWVLREKWGS
jgi:hypothetical protein